MIVYACTAITTISDAPHSLDVDRLRKQMQRLLASGIRHFIVDLSQYQCIDDPMTAPLVRVLKVAVESQGKIAIVAGARIRRLFEVTGLTQVFPVHDQLRDALAALDRPEEVMMNSSEVISLLRDRPGLSDREITDMLLGRGKAQQSVNGMCRRLAREGVVERRQRPDGILGNYLTDAGTLEPLSQAVEPKGHQSMKQGEDQVQQTLATYLRSLGWTIRHLAHGKSHGVDIEAECGGQRWLIEVKGSGSRPEMRQNYFLNVLGQILCRMNDPAAQYSIAVPDTPQFRKLWSRFPAEAKSRTQITALFVSQADVEESK